MTTRPFGAVFLEAPPNIVADFVVRINGRRRRCPDANRETVSALCLSAVASWSLWPWLALPRLIAALEGSEQFLGVGAAFAIGKTEVAVRVLDGVKALVGVDDGWLCH